MQRRPRHIPSPGGEFGESPWGRSTQPKHDPFMGLRLGKRFAQRHAEVADFLFGEGRHHRSFRHRIEQPFGLTLDVQFRENRCPVLKAQGERMREPLGDHWATVSGDRLQPDKAVRLLPTALPSRTHRPN